MDKADKARLVAAVRPVAPLGRHLLGPAWPSFLAHFERLAAALSPALRRTGEFLLLDLAAAASSVAALRAAVDAAKAAVGWTSSTGPAPLQILLCADAERCTRAPVWGLLPPEELHLSSELKGAWRTLEGRRELGAATIGEELLGVLPLRWDGSSSGEELFPLTAAPLLGSGEECFCCGRTDHQPAACPSKLLSPGVHGLSALSEHPLSDLGRLHRQSLLEYGAFVSRATLGIAPRDPRQSPGLALWTAFFDLTRPYQLRFLMELAFSTAGRWPGMGTPGRELSTSRSHLFLALDCLRVGRRAEAVALLGDKAKIGSSNQFYAGVGMAFAALEESGPKGMIPELTRAGKLVSSREEHLYRLLLLSRIFELLGDLDEAQRHAGDARSFVPGYAEARYRCAQLAVRAGLPEGALETLKELAREDEDYFHAMLLDPQFLAVRHRLERELRSVYDGARENAERALAGAEAECEALAAWLGAEDQELEGNLATLGRFRDQVGAGGYGQVRSVASRAAGILVACRSLKDRRMRRAAEELAKKATRWRHFTKIWSEYPYKRFAHKYVQTLREAETELGKAERLLRSGELATYAAVRELLESVERPLASLTALAEDLRWLGRAVGFGKRFLRRLLLLEAVFIPLCLLVLLGLDWAVGHEWLGPLTRALSSSHLQRSTALVLCWIVAPLLALFAPQRQG